MHSDNNSVLIIWLERTVKIEITMEKNQAKPNKMQLKTRQVKKKLYDNAIRRY